MLDSKLFENKFVIVYLIVEHVMKKLYITIRF